MSTVAWNHGLRLQMLPCLWLPGQGLGLLPQALHVPCVYSGGVSEQVSRGKWQTQSD